MARLEVHKGPKGKQLMTAYVMNYLFRLVLKRLFGG